MKKLLPILFLAVPAFAFETFETLPAGTFTAINTPEGRLTVEEGKAEITAVRAKSGQNALRMAGGEKNTLRLTLPKASGQDTELAFWAERWTSQAPFAFTVTAEGPFGSREILNGAKTIQIGGFKTHCRAVLPKETQSILFTAVTPADKGVLIDDLAVLPATPMVIASAETITATTPIFIRREQNPVLGISIQTEGRLNPIVISEITLEKNTKAGIDHVAVYGGYDKPVIGQPRLFAKDHAQSLKITLKGKYTLDPGANVLWISVTPTPNASLDTMLGATLTGVKTADGKTLEISGEKTGIQRVGYAVTIPNDKIETNKRISKFFRIPGIAQTQKGTLVAVFDNRYNHNGDLPADIDVGVSRSTDGGKTWSPIRIALTAKNEEFAQPGDGCGDPAILVDAVTGRIWVAGLWGRGLHPIWGSKTGTLDPRTCGQMLLAYSDDDGRTWSKPINITPQVKSIETGTGSDWGAVFQGPGNGITLKDGTLLFAGQYWADDTAGEKAHRRGHSNLIYSKDRGKTWQSSRPGIRENTSEAQVAQLPDGSIMLNARNEGRNGWRVAGTTRDLGATWEIHPTSHNSTGLSEPTCQGSLLAVGGDLFFSNPASHRARDRMTLRRSSDSGATWPAALLYDQRNGLGYSCLTPVDASHIGVFYEGEPGYLYFLRIPYSDLKK